MARRARLPRGSTELSDFVVFGSLGSVTGRRSSSNVLELEGVCGGEMEIARFSQKGRSDSSLSLGERDGLLRIRFAIGPSERLRNEGSLRSSLRTGVAGMSSIFLQIMQCY